MSKFKKIALGFIAILVVLVFGISLFVGNKLLHPKKHNYLSLSNDLASKVEELEFYDLRNELKLSGWYFKAKKPKGVVILVHGYLHNRMQFNEKTEGLVKGLLDNSLDVLLFDCRNSGKSQGDKTTVGILEKYDLLGAINFASKRHQNIILLGYSMGASMSLQAASENNDIDIVIADSPFADLKTYLNANMSYWSGLPSIPFNFTIQFVIKNFYKLNPKEMSPVSNLDKINNKAVLFVHGNGDKAIPYTNSEKMYEEYKGFSSKTEFWIPEGVGHIKAYEVYPDEYIKRVNAFINKNL